MDREPPPEWLERESALDEVYMAPLGWFVHAFASAESMLFRLLVEKSGLSASEGAAVFTGLRMKAAVDALNRLFEAKGMELEKDALSRPFKQLGEINSVRDDILHYGTEETDDGELFVTNREKRHLPERSTTRQVSISDLIRMTYDLREIEVHFVASMFRTAKKRDHRMIALYTQRLADPWSYRPRAPVPHRSSGRGKRRAPSPPPPPSQE
jgi:hypothetical protein